MIIEVYKDEAKEWRWRCKNKGRIKADSGEGYKRKASCLKSISTMFLPTIKIVIFLSLCLLFALPAHGQDLVRPKMPTQATLTSNPPTNNRVWYEYAVALEGKVNNQIQTIQLINADLASAQQQLTDTRKQLADAQASLGNLPTLAAILARLTSIEANQSLNAIKVTLTAASSTATLSWDYVGNQATGFRVERSKDGASFTQLAVVTDPAARSYADKAVPPGTYWWRVKAIAPAGDSAPSNAPSATIP